MSDKINILCVLLMWISLSYVTNTYSASSKACKYNAHTNLAKLLDVHS